MPAYLSPNGKSKLVVDRVITLGGGRAICELQGQFFSLGGQFLEDMSIAESLPEPYRARAIKFVKQFREAKAKEEAVVEGAQEDQPVAHLTTEPPPRTIDIRTSEERAQEPG